MTTDKRPAYDTKEGVLGYLYNLEWLNRLKRERHEAGYKREEELHEFCVLGRFYFDSSGNCGPMIEGAPARLYRVSKYDPESRCPPVMTQDELEIFLRGETMSWSSETPFAPHDAKCTYCGKAWTIEDCHDIVYVEEQYPEGYAHVKCYRREVARVQREFFEVCFATAGFKRVNLISIPNEYWPKERGTGELPPYAAPWYLAQVGDGGVFKIGWRKSVINIDWSATGRKIERSLYASPEDDWVTHEPEYTHAHGYAKAAEYLAKIVPMLQECTLP